MFAIFFGDDLITKAMRVLEPLRVMTAEQPCVVDGAARWIFELDPQEAEAFRVPEAYVGALGVSDLHWVWAIGCGSLKPVQKLDKMLETATKPVKGPRRDTSTRTPAFPALTGSCSLTKA